MANTTSCEIQGNTKQQNVTTLFLQNNFFQANIAAKDGTDRQIN